MKALAIIPARGGSKGVPRKNLRTVGGLTLIERSIIHARESYSIDRIVVTSDDEEILEHAADCRAEVVKRPGRLATDDAGTDETMVHCLRALGFGGHTPEDHFTVLLQPTSPVRPARLIDNCFIQAKGYDSVFTAHEGHFVWKFSGKVEPQRWASVVPVSGTIRDRATRQKIKREHRVFIENGAVYISRTVLLMKEMNRLCGRVGMHLMSREDAIDIDSEYDLWLAETRVRFLGERLPRAEAADDYELKHAQRVAEAAQK